MKSEHAGRNGGGRNGGGRARVFWFHGSFLIFLVPDLGYLRYGLLGRGKTYKTLGKDCCLKSKVAHKREIPEFRQKKID